MDERELVAAVLNDHEHIALFNESVNVEEDEPLVDGLRDRLPSFGEWL